MTHLFSWSSIEQKACRPLIYFLVHGNLLELKSDSPSLETKMFHEYVVMLTLNFSIDFFI